MMEAYCNLDQSLIEPLLVAAGHVPDVLPNLVGFKPLALVEKVQAIMEKLGFVFRIEMSHKT